MSENTINIGNVSFNKRDVKSSAIVFKDGQKLNSVFLQDGTKITYKDQDVDAKAAVNVHLPNRKSGFTSFWGIKGLSIEGSNKDDKYSLIDCNDFTVDTRGGGSDSVTITKLANNNLNGNVLVDENDEVSEDKFYQKKVDE